jgi:AcrR family transcriptional regulator
VPRHPDPLRKPQLLAEILEYLLDKSLASVSFRTIAQALGVSTYTLVYQFGTRAQLLSDIVAAVSTRASGIEERLADGPASLDVYFEGLSESWEWTLVPRNRQLQRLEFEASLIEAVDPELHDFSRNLYGSWHRMGFTALEALGLSSEDAEYESRVIVDSFYGLQYDFVLNGDEDGATAAFRMSMARHRQRIEQLIERA